MTKRNHDSALITFEGIDGCGKSTQAALVAKYLQSRGYRVKLLREPGSTPVAERIRKILLSKRDPMSAVTELLLYQAARAEIVAQEIRPLLDRNYIVVCDRFYDSTTAYQGHGRKLDLRTVRSLNKIATGGLVPDITLVFDVDLDTAERRRGRNPDRLESESRAFFARVRAGFLAVARSDRRRVRVIDATRDVMVTFDSVKQIVNSKLGIA
jgi:dTMP kinase